MAEPKVKKSPWAKFGKALHIVVVAAFFLPFFGVSCADKDMPGESMDIITISGTDMAFGCAPGGLASEAKDQSERGGMTGGSLDMKIDKVPIEPLAIIALLLAVGGVLVAFLAKGRNAIMGSLIASVLCLGAVIGIYFKVGGEIKNDIAAKMKDDIEKSSMMRGSTVDSGGRMGLWISLGCLAGCIALSAMALKDRDSALPTARVVPPGDAPMV